MKASNFSLYIHCGVRYASFDGASWEAQPPVPAIDNAVKDEATGNFRSRNEVRGVMTRLSDSRARFVLTEDPVGATVTFARIAQAPPPCA